MSVTSGGVQISTLKLQHSLFSSCFTKDPNPNCDHGKDALAWNTSIDFPMGEQMYFVTRLWTSNKYLNTIGKCLTCSKFLFFPKSEHFS
jgi:hypothetical protein